jgi:hypothetical protein
VHVYASMYEDAAIKLASNASFWRSYTHPYIHTYIHTHMIHTHRHRQQTSLQNAAHSRPHTHTYIHDTYTQAQAADIAPERSALKPSYTPDASLAPSSKTANTLPPQSASPITTPQPTTPTYTSPGRGSPSYSTNSNNAITQSESTSSSPNINNNNNNNYNGEALYKRAFKEASDRRLAHILSANSGDSAPPVSTGIISRASGSHSTQTPTPNQSADFVITASPLDGVETDQQSQTPTENYVPPIIEVPAPLQSKITPQSKRLPSAVSVPSAPRPAIKLPQNPKLQGSSMLPQ